MLSKVTDLDANQKSMQLPVNQ